MVVINLHSWVKIPMDGSLEAKIIVIPYRRILATEDSRMKGL